MPDDPTRTLEGKATATMRRGLEPGTVLGKYTLERVLGEGGMGIVWAARDPDLERTVAIKLLHNAQATPEQRQRLLREARAMARLKHPNVLTVYEVDSDGDRDYIAMELVEGANLDTWLTAKPLHSEVLAAVLAAGRGLAAAHAAGLVHRDFKPHNVLRSRDGRVLVTDFGLARGTGDGIGDVPVLPKGDVELAETLAPPDSPLTQPGSLVGTPSYMAPEQFAGSAPDPRTDQFAFCVTAWQAFAGERPFSGQSLDELRDAASAGVATVAANMPRAIRAVLARGLAKAPTDRWPDMDALLANLEKAEAEPRRRKALIIPVLALGAAVALFVVMREKPKPPPVVNANGCAPIETAFDVWNTPRRDAFMKRMASHPNALALATGFDDFRTAWTARYEAACQAPPSPKITARLNCLLGERDDIDGIARLTDSIPSNALASIELWGLLPVVAACDGDSPIAPPLLPEDHKQRDAVIRVRAELAALRRDPQKLVDQHDAMVAHATALNWKPLVPEIEAATGAAAQLLGNYDGARTRFENAADASVRLADYKLEATARIGLLEIELGAMADPSDDAHIERLIAQASDAVQRAGNDPALATSVDNLVARNFVAHGKLDAGIAKYDAARTQLLAAKAYRSASVSTTQEIDALERRDQPGDQQRAWEIGRQTENAIASSGQTVRQNPEAMFQLAWMRDDFDEVHLRADRSELQPVVGGTKLTGKVLHPGGDPAGGALVVAWFGILQGDSYRVYTELDFKGAIAHTDATGGFTIDAPPGAMLIAQLGKERSVPIAATASPTVQLEKMHLVVGTANAQHLDAFARYRFGANEWIVRAPVNPNREFMLSGLISTPGELGLVGEAPWHQDKTIVGGPIVDKAKLAWPSGPLVDVVTATSTRAICVLRGRAIPKTQAELDQRLAKERDVASEAPTPVGVDNKTAVGVYQRGQVHAVFTDNAPGDITVCRETVTTPVCKIVALTRPMLLVL